MAKAEQLNKTTCAIDTHCQYYGGNLIAGQTQRDKGGQGRGGPDHWLTPHHWHSCTADKFNDELKNIYRNLQGIVVPEGPCSIVMVRRKRNKVHVCCCNKGCGNSVWHCCHVVNTLSLTLESRVLMLDCSRLGQQMRRRKRLLNHFVSVSIEVKEKRRSR